MVSVFRWFCIFGCGILQVACASGLGNSDIVAMLKGGNFEVLNHERVDSRRLETLAESNRLCHGFDLSRAQVRKYFMEAEKGPSSVSDEDYQISDCAVVGRVTLSDKIWDFRIYASGISELWIDPLRPIFLQCSTKDCERLFVF